MDLHLPGMNDVEALRQLRRSAETQHVPVIALTAAATVQDREQGEGAGFDRHLTKPVRMAELEAVLQSLLPRTEAPNAA